MILHDLGPVELRRRLASGGLVLRIGPYRVRPMSRLEPVANGLELLYSDFPVEEPSTFADFTLALASYRGMTNRFHAGVTLSVDGDRPFLPLPRHQSYAFFEWGLNWCVANRVLDALLFHSAVVELHGRAVLLVGAPGSGKSTLCAALVKAGWRLLSDEFAILEPATGDLVPLPRPISLKNRSIDLIDELEPRLPRSERIPDTAKGVIALMSAPSGDILRMDERAKPALVLFPRYTEGANLRVSRRSDGDAFLALAQHAFNYSLMGAVGFDALARLVRGRAAFEVEYGRLDQALDKVAAFAADASEAG